MVDSNPDLLDCEMRAFCHYLVGMPPDAYVVRHYRRAHELGALGLAEDSSEFDRVLVAIARSWPRLMRLIDVHSSVFGGTLFRKKIVLALGILENSPNFHCVIDSAVYRSRVAFAIGAIGVAGSYVSALVVGTLLFLPLRGWFLLFGTHR